jgi:hypothetical protein
VLALRGRDLRLLAMQVRRGAEVDEVDLGRAAERLGVGERFTAEGLLESSTRRLSRVSARGDAKPWIARQVGQRERAAEAQADDPYIEDRLADQTGAASYCLQ